MMITAAQRRGELQRGVDILAFSASIRRGLPLAGRDHGFTDPRARNDPRAETRLRQRHNPRRIFFQPAADGGSSPSAFRLRWPCAHLIDRFDHRFVVVCHREIILRLGDIELAFSLPLSIGSFSPAVTPICCAEARNRSLRWRASCRRNAIRFTSG